MSMKPKGYTAQPKGTTAKLSGSPKNFDSSRLEGHTAKPKGNTAKPSGILKIPDSSRPRGHTAQPKGITAKHSGSLKILETNCNQPFVNHILFTKLQHGGAGSSKNYTSHMKKEAHGLHSTAYGHYSKALGQTYDAWPGCSSHRDHGDCGWSDWGATKRGKRLRAL